MDKRFEFLEREGIMNTAQVIVDTETGVQYLMVTSGSAGGLTVLVDRNGLPLLDQRYNE